MFKYEWKVNNEKYEGRALISFPSIVERWNYIKSCGFKMDDSGDLAKNLDQLEPMSKLIGLAEKHVEQFEMKHKQSEASYNTYKDALCDPRFDGIVTQTAMLLLNGGEMLGN